jgi:1,4-dihydroxy-2-naphthoyl-CoA hydrolase
MSFNHRYTVQFRDTDAAGVVYFANLLSLCHGAYEASLITAGINLKSLISESDFALPIVRTEANFFHPLRWGDAIDIRLTCEQLTSAKFAVNYQIFKPDRDILLATALTIHIAIDPQTRSRQDLPSYLVSWLVSNSEGGGVG